MKPSLFNYKNHLLFSIAISALIIFRFYHLYEIQSYRELPIEIDDAYSYLYHAKVLDVDPSFDSPLMKSLKDIELADPHKTWRDLYNNRIYHRISFYHLGHAAITLIIKKLTGLSYEMVWWILTYLFNALLILFAGLLLRTLFSDTVALFAMGIFGLSLQYVAHQITAAPREWSTLFFIASLYYFIKRNTAGSLKILYSFPLIISLFFCLSSHPLGKLYLAQFTGCVLFLFLFKSINKMQTIKTLLYIAIAASIYQLIFWILQIPHYPKIPQSVDPSMTIVNALKLFFNKSIDLTFQMSALSSIKSGVMKMITAGLIGIGFMYTIVRRKRDFQHSLMFPLLLSAASIQIIMHFLVQDFRPATRYYYFGDYYYTFWFLITSLLFSLGLTFLLNKITPKSLFAMVTILGVAIIDFNLYSKNSALTELSNSLKKRHESIHSPKKLISVLEEQQKIKPSCVQFYSESNLFMYLTYANYQNPISYHPFCPSDLKKGFQEELFYSNKVNPRACQYVWIHKSEHCPQMNQYKVYFSDNDYQLLVKK